jgi:hypothetical protein
MDKVSIRFINMIVDSNKFTENMEVSMKYNILRITIMAIALFALTSLSHAAYIHFTLNITDNNTCYTPTWDGDYCVTVTIQLGTQVYCSHFQCDLKTGNNDIDYYCSIVAEERNPNYEIHVQVCRHESTWSCCDTDQKTGLYFYQCTDNSQTLSVTL